MARNNCLLISALLASIYLISCGTSDEPDALVGVEWLSEGSGETNEEPLMFARQGWRVDNNVYGGEVQLDDGQRVLRYETPEDWPFILYASYSSAGYLLHGSPIDQIFDQPILMVPNTVRVGMKWRSTPGENYEWQAFEVTERQIVETPLGERIIWAIRMNSEGGQVRTRFYAEGIGFMMNYAGDSTVEKLTTTGGKELFSSMARTRIIPLEDHAPDIEPSPPRSKLTELTLFNDFRHFWIESVQTYQTSDLSSKHRIDAKVYCPGDGFSLCGMEMLLTSEMEGTRNYVTDTAYTIDSYYERLPDITRWFDPDGGEHHHEDLKDSHHAEKIPAFYLRPKDDRVAHLRLLYVKNEFAWHEFYYNDDQERTKSRTLRMGPMPWLNIGPLMNIGSNNLVLGDYRDLYSPNFAAQDDLGLWRHWHLDDDLFSPTALVGLANEEIHLATTPERTERLITTLEGHIDRIVIDHDGLRRERLGTVDLPAGHVLTGVAPLNLVRPDRDPTFLVFTNIGRNITLFGANSPQDLGETFTWLTTFSDPPEPMHSNLRTSIDIDWRGFDAQVCWPATDEDLELDGWLLGGVKPAAVVHSADNCALLIRDLKATPLLDTATPDNPTVPSPNDYLPFGWTTIEGPIPGLGRTLLQKPFIADVTHRRNLPRPDQSSRLLTDGEGTWVFHRENSHSTGYDQPQPYGYRVDRFDAGGTYLGNIYFSYAFAAGYPTLIDESRGGVWRTVECTESNVIWEECEAVGWSVVLVGHDGKEHINIPTAFEDTINPTAPVKLLKILDDGRLFATRSGSPFLLIDDDGTIEELEFPEMEITFDYNNRTYDRLLNTWLQSPEGFRLESDLSYCGGTQVPVGGNSQGFAHIFYCSDSSGEAFRYAGHVSRRFDQYWDLPTEGFVLVTEIVDANSRVDHKLDLESMELTLYNYSDLNVPANTSMFQVLTRTEFFEHLTGVSPLMRHHDDQTLWHVSAEGLKQVEIDTDADWRAFLELNEDSDTSLEDHLIAVTDQVLLLTGHQWYDRPGGSNYTQIMVRVPYSYFNIVDTE